MEQKFLIKNLNDLKNLAHLIVKKITPNSYFLFFGKIGVGKTQLIKYIFKILKVNEVIFSPSFTILHQIKHNNLIFNHFDFYRLNKPSLKLNKQEIDLYIDFMIDNINFIEWPEIIESFVLKNKSNLRIDIYLDFNLENTNYRNCKIITY